eukprot:3639941-Alexandrium_andersonii.AAC.1
MSFEVVCLFAECRAQADRPAIAQAKLFVDRFPAEFREASMQKVALPCRKGQPFVAGDGLPCPVLSTFNALR